MKRIVLVLALFAGLAGACGGSTPSTASSAPDGASTCANADALKTAVGTLDAVDLATVSADDLKAAIDGVATATDRLIQGADADIAQNVADLEGAVNVLEAAYEEASGGPIADSAPAIEAAILDVNASAAEIDGMLKPACS